MGNIEMKEEMYVIQQECANCKGAGYVKKQLFNKYVDQELSPTQKRSRDECLECQGRGHLVLEQIDDKSFIL